MLSYKLDGKSVNTISRNEQRKRNSKINFLLVLAGLLTGNPTATGAGFLAHSGQDQSMKLKNVKKANFYSSSNTITLSSGYGEKSIVFCKKENYSEVSAHIRSVCSDSCKFREK
jgi:predicted nucleic acid-binding Zn ribbon protein